MRSRNGSIRVLVADDHPVYVDGLAAAIERAEDLELAGKCRDGAEALREIRAQAPDVAILILSMYDDERYLFEALKAGASGYVLKQKADQDLVDAVRAVGRGESFLTNSALRSLVREWMADASSGPREPLSPREQEVLKLIAEAHTNREISDLLGLSAKTVESHRASILRKLGMRDRVELVRYAIRRGLIEP